MTNPISTKVDPIPKDYHTIVPYLVFKNSKEAIDFYQKVFGGELIYKLEYNNKINHAEMKIGDSKIMFADENSAMNIKSSGGNESFSLIIFVKNPDETFDKAQKNGAKVLHKLANEYYGMRMGTIIDPFGYKWGISAQIEIVSNDEIQKRHKIFMEDMSKKETTLQKGGSDDYYFKMKYLKYKLKYGQLMKNKKY